MQAGSGAATFWSSLRAAAKMRDVFSIKMCPPLHDKTADVTIPQGGELVSHHIIDSHLKIGSQRFLQVTNMHVQHNHSIVNAQYVHQETGTGSVVQELAITSKLVLY